MDKRGGKHICANCQSRFYDLNRPDAKCPTCGKGVVTRPQTKVARAKISKQAGPAAKGNSPICVAGYLETDKDKEGTSLKTLAGAKRRVTNLDRPDLVGRYILAAAKFHQNI